MNIRLSQNQCKLLAAAAMVLDHVGYLLFPQITVLRIIGRIAFPIFAFSVFEGCRFTHNKPKYLFQMLALGLLCMAGYFWFTGKVLANVLITFSLSICILYAVARLKTVLFEKKWNAFHVLMGLGFALASFVAAGVVCSVIEVDYGVFGVLLPVWAELFCMGNGSASAPVNALKQRTLALVGFALGLLLLSAQMGGIQAYSLLALLPLALAGGTRGALSLKRFFYVFYPAHLAVIGAVSMLI